MQRNRFGFSYFVLSSTRRQNHSRGASVGSLHLFPPTSSLAGARHACNVIRSQPKPKSRSSSHIAGAARQRRGYYRVEIVLCVQDKEMKQAWCLAASSAAAL